MKTPILPETIHAQLAAVDLEAVEVVSKNRSIPRKEQAALTRQLLRKLGVKGISVTAPNYSMAQSVDVGLPKRRDYTIFRDGGCVDFSKDPACLANAAAKVKLRAILNKAFPNHDNRSDSQSDYFDYCWSIN